MYHLLRTSFSKEPKVRESGQNADLVLARHKHPEVVHLQAFLVTVESLDLEVTDAGASG